MYEYLAQRLLPTSGGGYFADGPTPEVHESLTAAINWHARHGWELDRFEPLPAEVWLVFRRCVDVQAST